MTLDQSFWSNRYETGQTGWDLGQVSPPIKSYFDEFEDKSVSILIPGCGNAYEAEYLVKIGFTNVHVIDLSEHPLNNLIARCAEFNKENAIQGDFFEHQGEYDYIIEQTMFCAIDPSLRQTYANKVYDLLKPNGKLVGVMFNREFPGGPPFGGSISEYENYFKQKFEQVKIEECYNSIAPRSGSECFIEIVK